MLLCKMEGGKLRCSLTGCIVAQFCLLSWIYKTSFKVVGISVVGWLVGFWA